MFGVNGFLGGVFCCMLTHKKCVLLSFVSGDNEKKETPVGFGIVVYYFLIGAFFDWWTRSATLALRQAPSFALAFVCSTFGPY